MAECEINTEGKIIEKWNEKILLIFTRPILLVSINKSYFPQKPKHVWYTQYKRYTLSDNLRRMVVSWNGRLWQRHT